MLRLVLLCRPLLLLRRALWRRRVLLLRLALLGRPLLLLRRGLLLRRVLLLLDPRAGLGLLGVRVVRARCSPPSGSRRW